MAIVKATDTVVSLNSSTQLPTDRYIVRCKKEEFGISKSSGNPMITRTWEIVSPDTIVVNGQSVVIAGTEILQYLTLKNIEDDAKTKAAVGRYLAENKKLGLYSDEVDNENPSLVCVGVVADAILASDENTRKKAPTPEQIAAGKKFGDNILGQDGKPIKSYQHKVGEILGVSTASVNKPY